MYAYIVKSSVVTTLLLRRLLRSITSVPGILVDVFLLAPLWLPRYRSYWDNSEMTYLDGTRVGVMEGILGFVGEILGFVIGIPLGAAIGLSVYIVDSVFWALKSVQQFVYSSFNKLATWVGRHEVTREYFAVAKDENRSYLDKAWNIGTVVLGGLLGFIPYLAARLIEFFIPVLGPSLSKLATHFFGLIGGTFFFLLALPLYPVVHFIQKTMELYQIIHEKIRSAVVVLYAKMGMDEIAMEALDFANVTHSQQFRAEVTRARASTWEALLFALPQEDELDVVVSHRVSDDGAEIDSITNEPIGYGGVPIVEDAAGHHFNDYGPGKGIRSWISQHHTSPLTRATLNESDLRPYVYHP